MTHDVWILIVDTYRLFGLQQPYFLLQSSVFDLQLKYNKVNYHFPPLKQLELGDFARYAM